MAQAAGGTAALVVAAGSGARAGGGVPKQYRRIGGRPLLAHTLDAFRHPGIDLIQVVIGDGHEDGYAEATAGFALLPPVTGGATRRHSVRNGLKALAATGAVDKVLIHDAARPFLPAAVLDRLLAALSAHEAAVPVLPAVDTLATTDGKLGDVVARDGVVRVQTPQAFRLAAVFRAHSEWTGGEASDDAQMVRAAGIEVALVAGDPALEKLTYEADFARAEAMLAARRVPRTGSGFDVHRFGPGDGVWLGGVRIPHSAGLIGHSDADVALHALADALLGAVAAGDIGDHFPPSDPRWRGAASSLFVEHVRELVERAGAVIAHVDVTILAEAPKVAPHREAMRARIAALLRVPLPSVSIKATTTERLGFVGRGEGIAAQAIATVLTKGE